MYSIETWKHKTAEQDIIRNKLLASFLERKKKEEKIKKISMHNNWKEINAESETGVTGLSLQGKTNNSKNKEKEAQ